MEKQKDAKEPTNNASGQRVYSKMDLATVRDD